MYLSFSGAELLQRITNSEVVVSLKDGLLRLYVLTNVTLVRSMPRDGYQDNH